MWQYNNTLSHYGKVGMKWGKRGVSKADYKSIKKKAVNDFNTERSATRQHAKEASKMANGAYERIVQKKVSDVLNPKYVAKSAFTSAVVTASIAAAGMTSVRGVSENNKVALVAGAAAVSALISAGSAKRYQSRITNATGVASVRSRIEEGLKKK